MAFTEHTGPPTWEQLRDLWLRAVPHAGPSEKFDREQNFWTWAAAQGAERWITSSMNKIVEVYAPDHKPPYLDPPIYEGAVSRASQALIDGEYPAVHYYDDGESWELLTVVVKGFQSWVKED